MPSQFRTVLNQLIQADLTVAEVNGATRGFAAYSLPKLTGQRIKLWGLIWAAVVSPADRANARAQLRLQRGLIITPDTTFPAAEDANQTIFTYEVDMAIQYPEPIFPPVPYTLEPGDSYALIMTIVPLAAFASGATLALSVMGKAEAIATSDIEMVL